jgi:c(7)-type cytochrome triheme protein
MKMNDGLFPVLSALVLVLAVSPAWAQTFGVKKRPVKPHEFGNVTMNSYSEQNDMAPVVFNHWLHRMKYSCRLCHVDLSFAMQAGDTGIREADNLNGIYCGTCHDGRESFAPEEKDPSGETKKNCDRCHSGGRKVEFKNNFYTITKGFPRARGGNRIDWLKAEEAGLLTLKDQLEGVTIERKPLKIPLESDITAKEIKMPDIIFSHEKHAVWNGCELCHPELFAVEKGVTVYTMQEIFDGKFCGACHGNVAFVTMDCQLCHVKEMY